VPILGTAEVAATPTVRLAAETGTKTKAETTAQEFGLAHFRAAIANTRTEKVAKVIPRTIDRSGLVHIVPVIGSRESPMAKTMHEDDKRINFTVALIILIIVPVRLNGICYLGRTGSCAVHAALLGWGVAWGPQVHIDSPRHLESFVAARSSGITNKIVSREVCQEISSEEESLFNHFPAEGQGVDFLDHSECTCGNPLQLSSDPLLHLHSLLYSEALFSSLFQLQRSGIVVPRLVITRSSVEREVLSLYSYHLKLREGLVGRAYSLSERTTFFATCINKHVLAQFRLRAIQGHGGATKEVLIDSVNENPEAQFQQLDSFFNPKNSPKSRVITNQPLELRGRKWTGGRTPPFGNAKVPSETFASSKAIRWMTSTGYSKFFYVHPKALILDGLVAIMLAVNLWERAFHVIPPKNPVPAPLDIRLPVVEYLSLRRQMVRSARVMSSDPILYK